MTLAFMCERQWLKKLYNIENQIACQNINACQVSGGDGGVGVGVGGSGSVGGGGGVCVCVYLTTH